MTGLDRYAELCGGIGGFGLGYRAVNPNARCVLYVEKHKPARETYFANHAPVPAVHHDIHKVENVPDFDVLFCGFPCQPFSQLGYAGNCRYGNMHGLQNREKGQIIWEVLRIARQARPKVMLLENVPYILHINGGRDFRTICERIEEAGWWVTWSRVNSCYWVPQARSRIYMVCWRKDLDIWPMFPMIGYPNPAVPLPSRTVLDTDPGPGPEHDLSDRVWQSIQRRDAVAKMKVALNPEDTKAKSAYNFRKLQFVDPDRPTITLLASHYDSTKSHMLVRTPEPRNPRKLTLRECSRLMGFDMPGCPEWNMPGKYGSLVRQFGNAVVPPVVTAIMEGVMDHVRD